MAQYSIVIPAYNEGARLGTTLERVLAYISAEGWDAEVIVVNDGSQDLTPQLVESFRRFNPSVQLLNNPENRGKGYSVRNGILHARGEVLLFSDADLSSPIEEASKLFMAIEDGADIAIGSRWLQPGLQSQRQSALRQLYGRIYNLLLRIMLGLKFKDTQCGFKAFTRAAALRIFSQQRIDRWGFDPELLFLAQKSGLRVDEVPVVWAHDERTRMNPLRDGLRMFAEVIRVRWNAVSGKYSSSSGQAADAPARK